MGVYVIPAFQAEGTIASVVRELAAHAETPVVVVDDGSTDGTSACAAGAGATVVRHGANRGKGAALKTGLEWARDHGHEVVVSLDADGQHRPADAVKLMHHPAEVGALVLGVRDLRKARAPIANQRSNAFSNLVLSWFAGARLLDTQCGLRRYPVRATLALGARDDGFAFESDAVLRAARTGMPIAHTPCDVVYPPDRKTHFDSVRDPARIVGRVVATWLCVPHHRVLRRLVERTFVLLGLTAVLLFSMHRAIDWMAHMEEPRPDFSRLQRVEVAGRRKVGEAEAQKRQGIWEVELTGTAAQIGWDHARLLREEMAETEGSLLGSFGRYVPTAAARSLLMDVARFRYRSVDRGMTTARLEELAAEAAGFDPDPFADFLPTYERFVYLNALYDISLSLEHSPLLGCTTFTAPSGGETNGPLLARVFDFEVHDVFDRQKAVFFVHEDGTMPFASVAWPGLVGVVTGMNAAGVAMVVHGARGGEFVTRGEPVVHAVRRVLGQAHSTEEALRLFDEQPAMVSHIVVVQDAAGNAARFERAPGRRATPIQLVGVSAVSNHFEGPLASDPKNLRVMRETSTVDRRSRGDVLIGSHAGPVDVRLLAGFLRDRRDAQGRELPLGDRRAIDADIATHAVIMDSAARVMWVNQGPHLRGDFVRYDLREVFDRGELPAPGVVRPVLPL